MNPRHLTLPTILFLGMLCLAAREIASQYVVTYTPKRPLAEATVEEYRRINVASGVIGLQVHARRGYVARAQ